METQPRALAGYTMRDPTATAVNIILTAFRFRRFKALKMQPQRATPTFCKMYPKAMPVTKPRRRGCMSGGLPSVEVAGQRNTHGKHHGGEDKGRGRQLGHARDHV